MVTLSLTEWIVIFLIAFTACVLAVRIGVGMGWFRERGKSDNGTFLRVKPPVVVRHDAGMDGGFRDDSSASSGERGRQVRGQGLTGADWETEFDDEPSKEVSLDRSFTREIEIINPGNELSSGGVAGPPAGWYRDPFGGSFLRYWDGTRWTESTALLG